MKIELEGILLSDTREQTGGTLEGRSISNVCANDDRNIVMHNIPGMEGSVFQDMGRTAVRIAFEGIISGNSARNVIEMIRSKFKSGVPVTFNSDISGATDITKVIIDDFRVSDSSGNKDRYNYSISLKEYKSPPAAQTSTPSQDDAAETWANQTAEDASGPESTGDDTNIGEGSGGSTAAGGASDREKGTSGDIPPPGETAQPAVPAPTPIANEVKGPGPA
jgi:hypothetical protein